MTDRQALVVGASSDIGRAVAVELAGLGYALSLWGRDPARLAATARAAGGAVDVVDLAASGTLPAAVAQVADRGPLAAVVYAAGLFDWAPADAADAAKHGLAGLSRATFLDVRDRGVKVSLVSPGLVAAGAGLAAPAARHPERLLAPADVAAAVRFVVTFPARGCPTEIRLQPQHSPD
ncbi:SDR family NAD(P)-dependent oxidoreductase [Spirilliplanes yamanashiensis]|uniref:Uncharacterized protein n=1 Tax=Spirilliplanes yamanashiensis TaxID=42233 RepID=A0A8J3YBK5_9ACTN|nr:SDR family NAD(P)-dependent oxidoreductase [Spirilliplanes yamanashiensis]MDP9818074.1 NADP-dependent 3-hydroxy acid dehydrogenase YdfG [Spirilliplanes yamanashiensis]GIJ04884.1 hypothetical protein Sya03_42360 [Spirilliplanes yamanashiensis]